jgi:tripartite-type tricarboxylate transporter receptor subunit TctC
MKTTLIVVLFLFMVTPNLPAQTNFYEGKTIRVIVGGSAGGGFDTYSRVIARHMGKHIPGNPNLFVENMAGAATRITAKYLFSVAKPDGLTFGIFNGYLIAGRVLGAQGLDFDVRKYEWIGVPVQDNVSCGLTKVSGIANVEQWVKSKSPVKLGGLGPGNSVSDVPRVIQAALGLPIQLVEGYKGTAEVRLAADGGELAGACWAWESMKVTWKKGLESGNVKIVLQVTATKQPDLPNVPVALELAKTEEAKQLIRYGVLLPSDITRVYATTPGTPTGRVQTLRRAFAATLTDPKFVEETTKANLEINPLTGEEVAKHVGEMFDMSPSLKSKLASVLAVK